MVDINGRILEKLSWLLPVVILELGPEVPDAGDQETRNYKFCKVCYGL